MSIVGRLRKLIGLSKDTVNTEPVSKTLLIRSTTTELPQNYLSSREERIPSRLPLHLLETIYRIDGQVFGIINSYVRDIVSVGYTITGSYSNEVQQWCNQPNINFNKILQIVVRDCLIYGNGYLELVYNRGKTDIVKLLVINPKSMDFARDSRGNIVRDEYGEPVAYTQDVGLDTDIRTGIEKDFIDKWGISLRSRQILIPREHIAHFYFYSLGDTPMGISPLEPLYKTILYKLNIEEVAGELTYRTGYSPIIARIGDLSNNPTPEEVDHLTNTLRNLTSNSVITVPYWVEIKRLEQPKTEQSTEILNYFSNIIKSCLKVPKDSSEPEYRDYERTVRAFQEDLASQIREQIFSRLCKVRGYNDIPSINFKEVVPTTKLAKARRLGIYSRSGMLTWDKELEDAMRTDEGLPKLPGNLSEEEIIRRSNIQVKRIR